MSNPNHSIEGARLEYLARLLAVQDGVRSANEAPADTSGYAGRAREILVALTMVPVPMLLWCPAPGCGAQHIDAPEPETGWTNPAHRSHTCHACGAIWRPADFATTGVAAILTKGKADTFVLPYSIETHLDALQESATPYPGAPAP